MFKKCKIFEPNPRCLSKMLNICVFMAASTSAVHSVMNSVKLSLLNSNSRSPSITFSAIFVEHKHVFIFLQLQFILQKYGLGILFPGLVRIFPGLGILFQGLGRIFPGSGILFPCLGRIFSV